MPRRTTIKSFPFLDGQHQEVDAKIMPDGYLSACKNVRLRKDGRFGVRADFTAIGNDTGGANDLVPRDLIGYGDALSALGDASGISGETALWDIHDYSGLTPAEWTPSAGLDATTADLIRLGQATNLRTLAAYSATVGASISITRIDCAAAEGIVCVAYTDGSTCFFHFLRASDGSTVYQTSLTGTKPRVVAVSSTFFIVAFDPATGLLLSKFSPLTDTAASALTAPTGAALNCFDVVLKRALNGFWIVFNTAASTTSIVPYNSSGVAGSAITGPAVAYAHVSVVETATRVHLGTVTAVPTGEIYSYTLAGALSTGPTAWTGSPLSQPAMVDATYSGTEQVSIYYDRSTGVFSQQFHATTHATPGATGQAVLALGAKPLMSGTPNFHGVFGFVPNDGAFFSSCIKETVPSEAFGQPGAVSALINKFAAARVSADHIPKIARDAVTGKLYWPSLSVNDQSISRPLVTEFDFLSSARRQSMQIAGLLYVGGGAVGVYDTRLLHQSGFFLKPRITAAVASNGAGSLPNSVSLLTAISPEGRDALGNIVQGDVSDVSTVAMGGADDTITLTISSPIGLTVADRVTVGYRSISGINQLRRAETSTTSSLVYLADDATVRTHGIIYTQAGRGALSGTTPYETPFPADFLCKWGSRILAANADQAFVSREIFPGEQATWSQAVGFTIPKISERIKGVAALDQRGILFTSERIYWFSGDGPNDLGEGRYSEPLPLPSSTGLEDWRSLVETPLGIFFQGSNGQLWVLPRDGSPPVWIGQPVRDTLVSFPVVTSATLVTEEQLVSFTCNNTGGTDSRVVSYDLRAKTWIVDEFTSAFPITAACSYQGRLALISGGVVYTEKTTLTPNTFIQHEVTSGTVKPDNWHKIVRFGVIGEYRGDCDLYARISHDDGKTFTTMTKIQQLRSASYAVGDTVDVEWTPARWKTDGFRLDFSARTPGSATEGFVFNEWWIEYLPERGGSRRASGQRG